MSTQAQSLREEYLLARQIIASRNQGITVPGIQNQDLPQSLVTIFTILDENYFDLSKTSVVLKQTLAHKQAELDSVQVVLTETLEQTVSTKKENTLLRQEVGEISVRLQELEDKMEANKLRLLESDTKITQQQRLLSSQYQQLSEIASKYTELQHQKANLEERVKVTSAEKDEIRNSLSEQIQQIDDVRERQRTKIDNVTHQVQQYFSKIQAIGNERDQLQGLLIQAEGDVTRLKILLEGEIRIKEGALTERTLAQGKLQDMKQHTDRLQKKEKQYEEIREEYVILKDKQGNFQMMLQNLAAQKNQLDRQITRMTEEYRRKMSDSESINTDKAIQTVSQTFMGSIINPHLNQIDQRDKRSLSQSFQEIGNRKTSCANPASQSDHTLVNQTLLEVNKRVLTLQSENASLQILISRLKTQLDEIGNVKTLESDTVDTVLSPAKEDEDIVLDKYNMCLSQDQPKQFTVLKFQTSVRPQIRLFSLYSVPGVKLPPRNKVQVLVQTQSFDRPSSTHYDYKLQNRTKHQFQIHKETRTREELGFFDRLSKMFCGGPSE